VHCWLSSSSPSGEPLGFADIARLSRKLGIASASTVKPMSVLVATVEGSDVVRVGVTKSEKTAITFHRLLQQACSHHEVACLLTRHQIVNLPLPSPGVTAYWSQASLGSIAKATP
jgi:hypothetical protein